MAPGKLKMGISLKGRASLIIPVFLIFLFYALWSYIIPPFESPDETGHVDYIRYLVENRGLPMTKGHQYDEYVQPPLYYAVMTIPYYFSFGPGADFRLEPRGVVSTKARKVNIFVHDSEYWENQKPLFILRLANLIWAVGTLIVSVALSRLIEKKSGLSVAWVPFIVALLPQSMFISASINNDNAAVFFGALALYMLLLNVLEDRYFAVTGLCLGLAYLSKATTLFLLPTAAVSILVLVEKGYLQRLGRIGAMILAFLCVAAPYMFYNHFIWGDFLGSAARTIYFGDLIGEKWTAYAMAVAAYDFFRSFWGMFGWGTVRYPVLVYAGLFIFTILSASGLFLKRKSFRGEFVFLLAIFMSLAVIAAAAVKYSIHAVCSRHMSPVLFPVFYFAVIGGDALLLRYFGASRGPAWNRDAFEMLQRSIFAGMLVLNVYSLFLVRYRLW